MMEIAGITFVIGVILYFISVILIIMWGMWK